MNIAMLLELAVAAFGERVVITGASGSLTPVELQARAMAGAEVLQAQNAQSVVYLSSHGPHFAVATFAAALAGVPVIPLNYRLGAQQLTALVARHHGALVLCGDAALARAVSSAGAGGAVDPAAWVAALDGDGFVAPPEDVELPAFLLYTSGTTSEPKAVVLRHRHLASYVLSTVELGAAGDDEAVLICVPPYHVAGVANLLSNLYAGRRAVILETFTPETWLDTVRAQRVTHAMVVPTMLARLVSHLGDGPADVPTLRSIAYGGARTPPAVLERALGVFAHVDFVHAYGLTETSSTIAILGPDEHRGALAEGDSPAKARLASVGRVIPGVEIEVRGVDGSPLPPGTPGRVWLRGEQISGEYAGAGTALDPGGWFDTRDRGMVDDDGYLFIEGRDDDTIIRGAENIAPAEIEDVLLCCDGVADAVVVGVPDDEWGQRIAAVVVPEPGYQLEPDAVRVFARERLRSSKTPETVVVWDDLPRTDNGKVIRRIVVEQLSAPNPSQERPT